MSSLFVAGVSAHTGFCQMCGVNCQCGQQQAISEAPHATSSTCVSMPALQAQCCDVGSCQIAPKEESLVSSLNPEQKLSYALLSNAATALFAIPLINENQAYHLLETFQQFSPIYLQTLSLRF